MKKYKMAAKNPKWPPKNKFLLIIFETINIFRQHNEAINFIGSFYIYMVTFIKKCL